MKIVSLERHEDETKKNRCNQNQNSSLSSLSLSLYPLFSSPSISFAPISARVIRRMHDKCRFRAAPSYIFFRWNHRSACTTPREIPVTNARIIFRSSIHENLYYLALPLIAKSEPIRLVMIDKRPYINNSRYSVRQ